MPYACEKYVCVSIGFNFAYDSCQMIITLCMYNHMHFDHQIPNQIIFFSFFFPLLSFGEEDVHETKQG